MTSKYRRTLSLEDLVNGSDDEMEELLYTEGPTLQPKDKDKPSYQYQISENAIKNGMRVGPIIAPGLDSPENDDFFLHGPQVPVLNLENSDLTPDMDPNQNPNSASAASAPSLPLRPKNVRFKDPDDRVKRVREQIDDVTGKMKDNVSRLLDREANLGSLQNLSDQLQYSSDIYRQSTEHLRRKMWWRQQRTRLVLAAVFTTGICLLIIPIITKLLQ